MPQGSGVNFSEGDRQTYLTEASLSHHNALSSGKCAEELSHDVIDGKCAELAGPYKDTNDRLENVTWADQQDTDYIPQRSVRPTINARARYVQVIYSLADRGHSALHCMHYALL